MRLKGIFLIYTYKKMELYEKVNKEKLHKVINCSNIPIKNPGDEYWACNLQEMLRKYTGKVSYHKKYMVDILVMVYNLAKKT